MPISADAARWRPHVTVAAVVEHEGRFLMVEEDRPEGRRLNQPAGHLERGEAPLDAVIRECLEETGRVFEPDGWLGVYLARRRPGFPGDGEDITYLRLAFTGRVGDRLPGLTLDEGIAGTVWLTLEEIHARRDMWRSPLVGRCVADHARGRRLPLEGLIVDPSVLFDGDGLGPFA